MKTRATFINCFLCWLFGHKWEEERIFVIDGDFEICSRCGLRGETIYYKKGDKMNQCKDCKWWGTHCPESLKPCGNFRIAFRSDSLLQLDCIGNIYTSKDFGCILWEKIGEGDTDRVSGK